MIKSHRRKVSVSQTHHCWRSPSRSMRRRPISNVDLGQASGQRKLTRKKEENAAPKSTISSRWRPKYWVLGLHPTAEKMHVTSAHQNTCSGCLWVHLTAWSLAGRRLVRSDTSGQNSLLKIWCNYGMSLPNGAQPFVFLGEDEYFCEASKVPQGVALGTSWLLCSTGLPLGYNGSHVPLGRGYILC